MKNINSLVSIGKNYGIENTNRLRNDIVSEYTEIINSLDTIDESVISKDLNLIPVYKINEGYAIDLDSLKLAVIIEQVTLEEAIQKIKNVNYIGDTYPIYCVLPKDINEHMSLFSFMDLNNVLMESNIIPVSTKIFNEEEFITEGLKIETWNEAKVRKTLDKYEKNLKELKIKRDEFEKLSPKEQKKYCAGKAVKNLIIGTGLSMAIPFVGGYVYSMYNTMKGNNTILGPKNYKAQLNNFIQAYNNDIKRLKKRLTELEKDKK